MKKREEIIDLDRHIFANENVHPGDVVIAVISGFVSNIYFAKSDICVSNNRYYTPTHSCSQNSQLLIFAK